MNALGSVRKFFIKVLQQVYNLKYVIAGDADAAACKHHKNQRYPDLCNSSIAVLLRQMQRENTLEQSIRIHGKL